jgi:hypothetical protein
MKKRNSKVDRTGERMESCHFEADDVRIKGSNLIAVFRAPSPDKSPPLL